MKKIVLMLSVIVVFMFGSDNQLACSDSQMKSIFNPAKHVYATSSDSHDYLLDKSTLKEVSRGVYKIWEVLVAKQVGKEDLIQFQRQYGKQSRYINYGYDKQLSQYDIINDKVLIVSFTKYNCDGSVIVTIEADGNWSNIVPNSAAEGKMNMVKELVKKNKKNK